MVKYYYLSEANWEKGGEGLRLIPCFCISFYLSSLIKKPTDRPGPEAMLEHAFIKERADPSQDLASWLKEVWNWK